MKPDFLITNRFRSYEPHIARPTPRKPPAMPIIDAINRRELPPLVKIGQGDTAMNYTPATRWSAITILHGAMWVGACVLLGGSMVLAGQLAIQMMRGL